MVLNCMKHACIAVKNNNKMFSDQILGAVQERGVRLPSNEPDEYLFDDEGGSMALMNDLYNAALTNLPAVKTTANPTSNSQPQTPTRGASVHGASPSKLRRGISSRNYLGIEPPVSLGSDGGGSGPLSRRGASGSGLEVFTAGGVGPFANYLPREGSSASIASGSGTPVHTTHDGSSRRSLRQGDGSSGGRVKRRRWGFAGGKQGSENQSSDEDENPIAVPSPKAWRLGAVQSVFSGTADTDSHRKPQEIENAQLDSARSDTVVGAGNKTSAPCMLMHDDVASGGTYTPGDTMFGEDCEEAMLQAIEPSAPLSPDLTCKAPRLHGSVLGVIGAAEPSIEPLRPGSFETPPPLGAVELSVIHELAPETSMTMPSTHESTLALGTPGIAHHNTPDTASIIQGNSSQRPSIGHTENAHSSVTTDDL